MKIKGKAEIILTKNNPYLGIVLDKDVIDKYLNNILPKTGLNKIDFWEYNSNLLRRNDNHAYHVTLGNPFKINSLPTPFLVKALTTEVEIEIKGMGSHSEKDNTTFFLPVVIDKQQSWIDKYGVELDNLHITVGFIEKDIHGIDKTKTNLYE